MEQEEREENEADNPDQVAQAPVNANDAQRRREISNEGKANGAGLPEDGSLEGEEEVDKNALRLEPWLLTQALKDFHQARDDRDDHKNMMTGTKGKKKSKDKSGDKQEEAEREKKRARMYWEQMTKILSEQKLSVWKALDKALGEYYGLLVDRQNLIEETGLLNQ